MPGNLPPGCTQRECDEAQPGYWDEPEDEDDHEYLEPDHRCGYLQQDHLGRAYCMRDDCECGPEIETRPATLEDLLDLDAEEEAAWEASWTRMLAEYGMTWADLLQP